MNLTDRAKQDFEKWYYDTYIKKNEEFEDLPKYLRLEIMDYLYNMPEIAVVAFQVCFMEVKGVTLSVFDQTEEEGFVNESEGEIEYRYFEKKYLGSLTFYSPVIDGFNDYKTQELSGIYGHLATLQIVAIGVFNKIYNENRL